MPASYTFGNTPRNILRRAGRVNTDLSLAKNFLLPGRTQFQFRAAFSQFNRPKTAQLRLPVGPPPCVFQHGGGEERAESTVFQAVVLSRIPDWRCHVCASLSY